MSFIQQVPPEVPQQQSESSLAQLTTLTDLKVACEKMIAKVVEKASLKDHDAQELSASWEAWKRSWALAETSFINAPAELPPSGKSSIETSCADDESEMRSEINFFTVPRPISLSQKLENARQQWLSSKPFILKLDDCHAEQPQWFKSSAAGPRAVDAECAKKIKVLVIPAAKGCNLEATFKRKLRAFDMDFDEDTLQFSFASDAQETKPRRRRRGGKSCAAATNTHAALVPGNRECNQGATSGSTWLEATMSDLFESPGADKGSGGVEFV